MREERKSNGLKTLPIEGKASHGQDGDVGADE